MEKFAERPLSRMTKCCRTPNKAINNCVSKPISKLGPGPGELLNVQASRVMASGIAATCRHLASMASPRANQHMPYNPYFPAHPINIQEGPEMRRHPVPEGGSFSATSQAALRDALAERDAEPRQICLQTWCSPSRQSAPTRPPITAAHLRKGTPVP